MSYRLRVIGPQDVGPVDVFDFFAGEDRTLKLQMIENDSGKSVPIPSNATNKTLTLAGVPNDLAIGDANISVDLVDNSIFSVHLTAAQTATLQTGEVKFSYKFVDPSFANNGVIRIATLPLGIKKNLTTL